MTEKRAKRLSKFVNILKKTDVIDWSYDTDSCGLNSLNGSFNTLIEGRVAFVVTPKKATVCVTPEINQGVTTVSLCAKMNADGFTCLKFLHGETVVFDLPSSFRSQKPGVLLIVVAISYFEIAEPKDADEKEVLV
jgi:hypothetical protein